MSYIKFEHRQLDDARWLDASPAAFVVHTWALDWSNEQATDGRIPTRRAHRLVCPVNPSEIPEAAERLIELGLWRLDGDDYVIDTFPLHGLEAAEQERTRAKWAEDKRRRRLCGIGNHDLCGPRSRCGKGSAGRPLVDSTADSATGQVDDPTRPDPSPKGEGGSGDGALRAFAPDGAPALAPLGEPRVGGVKVEPGTDPGWTWLTIEPGHSETSKQIADFLATTFEPSLLGGECRLVIGDPPGLSVPVDEAEALWLPLLTDKLEVFRRGQ